MSTRLYFTTTSASYTPATIRGAWDDTTGAAVYKLGRSRAGTNTAIATTETTATSSWDVLQARFVSDPLSGGDIAAISADPAYAVAIARQENDAAANMKMHLHMYFTVGDTDVVRGTLKVDAVGLTEMTTSLVVFWSDQYSNTDAVTVQSGDRLVVELGLRASNSVTTSFTGTIRVGGTAADLVATNNSTTGVTTDCPWIEFTAPFDAVLAPLGAVDGTIAATAKKLASSITGKQTVTGTVSAVKHHVTAAFTGTVSGAVGTVAAQAKKLTTSLLSGNTARTGTIAATLKKRTAVFPGTVTTATITKVLTLPGMGFETSSVMATLYDGYAKSSGRSYIHVPIHGGFSTVAQNVAILDDAIRANTGPKTVLAHSRGAQIAGEWIRQHQNDADRPSSGTLNFILCANPSSKYGAPPWDVNDVTGYTPPSNNGGWTVRDVRREGDGWANWPDSSNPFNSEGASLVKIAAALVGMITTHMLYFNVDLDNLDDDALQQFTEGNTTYYCMP